MPPSTSAVHLSGAGGHTFILMMKLVKPIRGMGTGAGIVWSQSHLDFSQEQQGGALGSSEDGCD